MTNEIKETLLQFSQTLNSYSNDLMRLANEMFEESRDINVILADYINIVDNIHDLNAEFDKILESPALNEMTDNEIIDMVKNTSIEILNLPTRANNALYRGLKSVENTRMTIYDVLSVSRSDLKSIRNLGKQSISITVEKINKYIARNIGEDYDYDKIHSIISKYDITDEFDTDEFERLAKKESLTDTDWYWLLNNGFVEYVINNDKANDWLGKLVNMGNDAASAMIANFDEEDRAVDLVSYPIISMIFSETSNMYPKSNIRKYLNNEFYDRFDLDIKKHIIPSSSLTYNYEVDSNIYTQENVKLLSMSEICGNYDDLRASLSTDHLPQHDEGKQYQVYAKGLADFSFGSRCIWTRTEYIDSECDAVWAKLSEGSAFEYSGSIITNPIYVVASIRFK